MARLGRFEQIEARLKLFDDSTIEVEYVFTAAPIIRNVVASGNREVSDQELAAVVGLIANTPANPFVIDQAKRRIRELYAKNGYYQADVTIDDKELREQGVVAFVIREGNRLRVTDIRFEGVASLERDELRSQIKTRTYNIINAGTLDDVQVQKDVAAVENYYKDRGFLRAQVDRQIQPSPDGKEAVLTFVVAEGPRYTVRSISVSLDDGTANGNGQPTTIIAPEQIAGLIPLRAGDPYSAEKVRRSVAAVRDAYGQMGYSDVRVRTVDRQSVDGAEADLVILVREGSRSMTGAVIVKGNETTRSNVVRRNVRVLPDRPLDSTAIEESRQKLEDSRLFARGVTRITAQAEDTSNPGHKDVLVEVKETDTGSFAYGASVGSDGGVVGNFSLTQRNFDITDWPDTWDEFFTGRAFHGGGQTFNITAQPGAELSNYFISLGEPALFDSDYSGSVAAGFRSREYRQYDESRGVANMGIGRRFGERWTGNLNLRLESVKISNIEPSAATDVFRDQGTNGLTAIGASFRRSALDKYVRPTRGSILDVGLERFGLFGGDYEFSRAKIESSLYIPVEEDVLGNRTVLLLRANARWIPEDPSNVPVYERLYLGGRDFRGFKNRGVGPRGPRNDAPALLAKDSIGGTYSFFLGAQIEKPLLENYIAGVAFIDTGTVTTDPGFDDYRVSAGIGVRVYIPQLGPVPLAADFGVPLMRADGDQKQIFSFSLDLPFQ